MNKFIAKRTTSEKPYLYSRLLVCFFEICDKIFDKIFGEAFDQGFGQGKKNKYSLQCLIGPKEPKKENKKKGK